jgi:LPS export ABC transporter protein LptC
MVSPRNIRLALALLVVTAIFGIVAAIFLNGSTSAPPETVSQQSSPSVDLTLRNARFTEVRNGVTAWTVTAERAEYSKEGEIAHLSGIRMVFAKKRTLGGMTVTADRGTYSTKSRNVSLRGKIHMTTDSGIIFDTNTLDYLASASRFVTADSVAFRQQRMRLTAQGMDLEVDDQVAHFHSAVNAVVERPKQR